MLIPVIAWILWQLDAPLWVWGFAIAKLAFEIYSTPFYLRLIKRDRDGR